MILQKNIVAIFLTIAFGAWFFASIPSISSFDTTSLSSVIASDHAEYVQNTSGILFQNISFEGVIYSFMVRVVEDSIFSLSFGETTLNGNQGISLFSFFIHQGKEKLLFFSALFGACLISLGKEAISVRLRLYAYSKERSGILSLLYRSRLKKSFFILPQKQVLAVIRRCLLF